MSPREEAPQDSSKDEPTWRQRLHSATGDRDREAKSVADRAPEDVDEDVAKEAVRRAAGDFGKAEPAAPHEMAHVHDAEAVEEERS